MKKILAKTAAVLLAFAAVFSGWRAVSARADADIVLAVKGKNVSYADSVYLLYAVSTTDASTGVSLLVWRNGTGNYTKGTEDAVLSPSSKMTVGGKLCDVFFVPVAAKALVDVFYTRAYSERGGNAFYSPVGSYSVLEFAYNKLGYTGKASTDAKFLNLLRSMLRYGGDAQIYFNYRTSALVTPEQTFFRVTCNGGTLTDGLSTGLFKQGAAVSVTAPETSGGKTFASWKDASGNVLSVSRNYSFTMGTENVTLTPSYDADAEGTAGETVMLRFGVPSSAGLEITDFTVSNDTALSVTSVTRDTTQTDIIGTASADGVFLGSATGESDIYVDMELLLKPGAAPGVYTVSAVGTRSVDFTDYDYTETKVIRINP